MIMSQGKIFSTALAILLGGALCLSSCIPPKSGEMLTQEQFIESTVAVGCLEQRHPGASMDEKESVMLDMAKKYEMSEEEFSEKYMKSMSIYMTNKEVLAEIGQQTKACEASPSESPSDSEQESDEQEPEEEATK